MPDRPNVLYLHSHDTGRFIEPYGGGGPAAPNLARLAARGTLYRDAECASPTCSPSRAALLTGEMPSACGQLGLGNRGFPLKRTDHHLVHPLKAAGYRTALLGVQHLVPDERDLGYDDLRPELIGHTVTGDNTHIDAGRVADATVGWLEAHGTGGPWFVDAGMVQTHSASWRMMSDGRRPTEADEERACPPPLLPPGPAGRRHWAHHAASVAILDEAVGRVLDALERLGLADDTLVIYTTDHGLGVPRGKCSLTDAGLAVGLIVRGPGFGAGVRSDRPTSHLDLAPTVLAAAGTSADWHVGVPLAEDVPPGRVLPSEINHHNVHQPERSVRDGRFRLVRRHEPAGDARPLDNVDPTPARAAWEALDPPPAVWPAPPRPQELLFDRVADPLNVNDLAADPAFAAERERLSTALQTHTLPPQRPAAR